MHLYFLIDAYALRQDGSKPLTANWDAGPYKLTARQFESNIATGTAPLLVASTTLVTNLNADLWDGYQFADYLDQAVKTTSSPTFVTGTFTDLIVDTNLIKTVSATNRIGFNVTSPTVSFDFLGTTLFTGSDGTVGAAPTAFTVVGGCGYDESDGGPISITAGDGGAGGELPGEDPGDGANLTLGGGGVGTDGGGGIGDAMDGVVRFVTDATLVTSDFLVPSGSTILLTEATSSPIEICSIGINTLCFSGTVEGYNLFVDFFTAKGDRSDTSLFQIFGYGKKSAFTNSESLVIGWGSGDQEYLIRTNKTGDGLAKPLNIYTYGNANQIYLNTDGSTNIGGATNYTEIKSDGEINLIGTAKVTNALWIGAEGVRAPPTKPAAFVDHGISGAWEFSDATDDTIVANMRIPNRMDRTAAPTITLGWSSTTLSAFCEWQIEYLWRSADEDTTAAADDTLLSSTDADASTSSGTAEGMVLTTFTLTAPSATDICLHLRIKRRGDLAADTINGDTVELHGICMNFTSNKLGTAT